jgi:hypothetical protein
LLVLSLSTQDRINHLFGPESQQAQDHFLRLDRALADFLTFLDDWVGLSSSLILLTADHGFPDSPEHCQEGGLEAGRIDQPQTARELNASLEAQFGPGRYVISWPATNNTVYLDRSGILERNLTARQVENAAAQFLLMQPGVETVLTKTEIESGPLPDTVTARQVRRSWDPDRSGDLYVIQKPCWFLLGGQCLHPRIAPRLRHPRPRPLPGSMVGSRGIPHSCSHRGHRANAGSSFGYQPTQRKRGTDFKGDSEVEAEEADHRPQTGGCAPFPLTSGLECGRRLSAPIPEGRS